MNIYNKIKLMIRLFKITPSLTHLNRLIKTQEYLDKYQCLIDAFNLNLSEISLKTDKGYYEMLIGSTPWFYRVPVVTYSKTMIISQEAFRDNTAESCIKFGLKEAIRSIKYCLNKEVFKEGHTPVLRELIYTEAWLDKDTLDVRIKVGCRLASIDNKQASEAP